MASFDYIIGVDEAGRGPLAGPVAVAAVATPRTRLAALCKACAGVRESKQLTPAAREEWFSTLCSLKADGVLDFRCAFSSERMIDRFGIVPACHRALARSLSDLRHAEAAGFGLAKAGLLCNPSRTLVLLDGGLRAPDTFPYQKTIIRGDETEMLIALASVVAKVRRDRYMIRLAKRHPEYGFDRHKGYGTRMHCDHIARHGLCAAHRISFCKKVPDLSVKNFRKTAATEGEAGFAAPHEGKSVRMNTAKRTSSMRRESAAVCD